MEQAQNPEFETELKTLLEAINHKYDYDFRHYAPNSMRRTVINAMHRMSCQSLSELQKKVLHDTDHFLDLVQSLTIPVSEMFRDPSYFLAIREMVIPILRTYPSLKIWIAGCSTGEEVYSLAIMLHEEDLLERAILYGTDINSRSLDKAISGTYSLEEMQGSSHNYQKSGGKHLLSNYYTVSHHSAKINRNLSQSITFADHSLVTDAAFSEMQFISCRNVLIYFNRDLQDKTFGLFYESLCRKGFLGLGSKETIQFSSYAKHFHPFAKDDRIFRKIS